MAAGKNFISQKYENLGWLSIDEDKQVHFAIEKATPQILKAFEQEAENANISLLNADSSLNRRNLGKLIFSHKNLIAKQESIVYPIITEETKKIIATNPEKNIILNVVALYKIPELLNMCEKIIFVTAPLLKRLCRAKKRDALPISQILQRFWSQRGLLNEYKKFNIPIEIVKN